MAYNHILNLGCWIEDMRDDALEPTDLNDRNIVVVNVGGGTNFTTLGLVNHMEPFKECNIIEGDVNLPFPTNYVNRYVSTGSYISNPLIELSVYMKSTIRCKILVVGICNTPNPYPSPEQGYRALPEFTYQIQ
ncbi:hypothetical protein Gotri_011722 [Gossypium trilobum]|uniref:Uncharacterized protein n=1 Tax=Gossypium trilobum TaxID=34281 RepID=A0A7J9EV61_9ROSI|nr:hypothetical protein [Gossypium trilobum]